MIEDMNKERRHAVRITYFSSYLAVILLFFNDITTNPRKRREHLRAWMYRDSSI